MSITSVPAYIRTLTEMQGSHFEFHLTGSRAGLRPVNPDSDWDFFVQDSPEVRNWLEIHDFVIFSEGYEDDPQIATVYRLRLSDLDSSIDVQLIGEVDKKLKVQHALLRHLALHGLDKLQSRRVWKAMYALLEDCEEPIIGIGSQLI